MIEEVKKWIEIANIDFYSAKELLNSENPLTLTACFHCQQAIEKYLKTTLDEAKEAIELAEKTKEFVLKKLGNEKE